MPIDWHSRSGILDWIYITKTTVGDNLDRIAEVLDLALDRSDVIITSGGIGPTVDDVTRQAVADATGRKLVYSTELESEIAARFSRFGRPMADNNKRQAYIPEGATPLTNPVGTAPCYLSEDVNGRGCIISLPGVPRELDHMMENTVIPLLIERMGGIKITRVRVLRTCAVGESNIDRGIGDLMTEGNPTVGLAAHIGQTDVRITAKADTDEEADTLVAGMEEKLRERLGVAVYGEGKVTVAEVVGDLMQEKSLKLGVVDTLTGGQLARDLVESGYSDLVAADLAPANLAEALKDSGADIFDPTDVEEARSHAVGLAERVTPSGGIGLAMIGPFEDSSTFIAMNGPGEGAILFERSRNYQDSDHIRRWLVVQAFDWIRRTLLGQMKSPVDWN